MRRGSPGEDRKLSWTIQDLHVALVCQEVAGGVLFPEIGHGRTSIDSSRVPCRASRKWIVVPKAAAIIFPGPKASLWYLSVPSVSWAAFKRICTDPAKLRHTDSECSGEAFNRHLLR